MYYDSRKDPIAFYFKEKMKAIFMNEQIQKILDKK